MKKQLNYKSLNTLGDVDITQSVVPGGGAGTESVSKYIKGIEYYAVDYDKLVELGYDSSDMNITTPSGMLNQALIPACGGKIFTNGLSLVLGPGMYDLYRGFFNAPIIGIYYINVLQQSPDDPSIWLPLTFKEFITDQPLGGVFNEAFTEITEDEFYKLPVALTIYTYYGDAMEHQDEMKTAFDTLWAIWERDGVEGEELAITIPNADIAGITLVTNDGEEGYSPTSMMGGTMTSTSDTVTYIELNGQYGPQIRKVENLNTGEITYEYYYQA